MDMQRQVMLADHSSLASSVKERLQCPRPAFQLISPMEAAAASASGPLMARPAERIERLVGENAVVVFSVSTCCMCHVAKKLLCGMGVSPLVVELDELDANSHLMALQDDVEDIEGGGPAPGGGPLLASGADIERALVQLTGERPAVPCVFVGGKLIGGLDRLMAAHISGSLIPQLKQAGALWL